MESITNLFVVLFESFGLYSTEGGLGDHLIGLDMNCNDASSQNIYNMIFLSILFINIAFALNYYYGLFNRQKFANIFSWFILSNLICGVIIFCIAFFNSYNDFSTANYCNQLNISINDCMGFALTALIWSIIFHFIISLGLKLKSTNNKKLPI